MIKFFTKKNRGFVILFAVTISAILLAIALGVSNIALKQVNFSTSAKNTNDAFFAADTGAECALYYDRSTPPPPNRFVWPDSSGVSITCANATFTPSLIGGSTSTAWSYSFNVLNLGSSTPPQGCAKVVISKDNSSGTTLTTIDSKGYNMGDSYCASTNTNRTEREIQLNY